MNSGFLITDAGLAAAAVATPTGPYIHITSFEIGSAFGYTPQRNQLSLQGTILYTGLASSYTVVDGDTVEIGLRMDATVGSFNFGEIGLRLASGDLFAILVFENQQEKVRAVGNQAGNTWYIRARIKLAQAPAIVQVTLINSQSILEVPNWQSLQKPGDQIMGANIAIVHANNSSDDPVLVIRDNDDEWGLVDYSRSFLGSTTDPGAVLGTTTFTHPDIANLYFEDMPRSDSRYLVKFPDGSIRQITSNPSPTQIGFTPGVSTAQSGQISIWEGGGGGGRVSWADTAEYNEFVNLFNNYWAASIGPYRSGVNNAPYSSSNRGSGQAAFATLARRTNAADWAALLTAVRNKCTVHNVPIADIASATDFVYRPLGATPGGMNTFKKQWEAFENKIPLLEGARNSFNYTLQDQTLADTIENSSFFATTWTISRRFTFSSEAVLQAQLNSGFNFVIQGDVYDIINPAWTTLNAALAAIGLIQIRHNRVTSSNGVGTTNNQGLQELPGGIWHIVWSYLHGSNWSIQVQLRKPAGINAIDIRIVTDATLVGPTDPYYGSPGTIRYRFFSRRASSALLSSPVLAYPNDSAI